MKQSITLICHDPAAVEKVAVIKAFRSLTGASLKDAKKNVEIAMSGATISIPLRHGLTEDEYKNGISSIKMAGLEVTNDPHINELKIKEKIKNTIAFCVECEEYNVAKNLIEVLQMYEK